MAPSVQFAALADPTRCRVVELLFEHARPVHELAAAFEISRPAISRHLRVLKDAGLVTEERHGRENVYSLERQQLRLLSGWLNQHWNARLGRLKALAEAASTPQMELDL